MPITQILLTQNSAGGGGGGGGGGGSAADFTIEWWQKVENNFNNARPWSVGLYPTQVLSLSYESMATDYFWINNAYIGTAVQNHVGQGWRHMAYVRSNSVVKGYVNGVEYFSFLGDGLITDTTTPFYVGTGETAAGTYKGYITDLHVMKGVAKYTGNFTPPTSFQYPQTGSVFILPAYGDGSGFDSVGAKTPAGATGTVTTSADVPFNTYGPYTQYTNTAGQDGNGVYSLTFSGANYNADLANVKAGWTVTDGTISGTVIADALDTGDMIDIPVSFDGVGQHTWTFTQPALISYYFDGSSYFYYTNGATWALDL